jgi:hypothetical protein
MSLETDWSVGGKRLIFTVGTGRNGTGYVSHLLHGLPGLSCLHEPDPQFYTVLRAVQTDPGVAERFCREQKLPAIRSVQEPVYFETSHLVCKGFLEPLMAHGVPFDLVILRRDPVLVATSLFLLGTVPARTELGRQFLLSPDDPGVLPLPNWQDLHDWALCYWYCLEIERRAQVYKERLAGLGGRVLETSVGILKTDRGLGEMLSFLGQDAKVLSTNQALRERRTEVVNDKSEHKSADRSKLIDPALKAAWVREINGRISRQATQG